MFCPSCGGEYREGFTTCADCEVPLVESLPAGELPSRGRRQRSGLERLAERSEELGPALRETVAPWRPWVRVLMVWLLLFSLVQAWASLRDLRTYLPLDLLVQTKAAIILRCLLVSLLPLACVLGILKRARWARLACLIYLPLAAIGEVFIIWYLWKAYSASTSLIVESPLPQLLPLLIGHLLVVIVNAIFFFLIQTRGFEEAPRLAELDYSSASIS
jgi:hypothetical protein